MKPFIKFSLIASIVLVVATAIAGDTFNGFVPARNQKIVPITLKRREPTRIVVDGSEDIDCDLINADGDILVRDNDDTSRCLLDWTSSYAGNFYIVVKNPTNSDAIYKGILFVRD